MSDRQLSGVRSHLIGFVFQSFFLLEGMTASTTLPTVCCTAASRWSIDADAAARHYVAGLGQRLTHTPSQMSGGERQR
jgi:putative ABC transport system ATP-binding protein